MPYDRYFADKGCSIAIPPTPYDATETKDLDYYDTIPSMNSTKIQRDNAQQERKDRLHFAAFVTSHVTKDILGGPEEVFEMEARQLTSDLRTHMLQAVVSA